ncbi:MAG: methyltransferase domain-containing protein [Armatimonadetes bacterium]|nr:methyltransferase domain-containing protein [Armatimonadota bacterium]
MSRPTGATGPGEGARPVDIVKAGCYTALRMTEVKIDSVNRPWVTSDTAALHCTVSPRLLAWVEDSVPVSSFTPRVVLDVGCGSGGLTFHLAKIVPRVVGIDLSESLIRETADKARDLGIENVEFLVADAERTDYRTITGEPIRMIVATLCMSDAIILRSSKALEQGFPFVFSCIESQQWQESGRSPRFAYEAEVLQHRLETSGFEVLDLWLERETLEFETADQMIDDFFDDGSLKGRWHKDGRWKTYVDYVKAGGRTFTARSHLLVNTRKG